METIKEYATLIKWLVILALAMVYTVGVHRDGTKRERVKWEAKVSKLELKAEKELSAAQGDLRAREQELYGHINQLEAQNVKDKDQAVVDLRNARAVIAAAGGLRDPGRREGSSCPGIQGAAAAGRSDGETGSKLSDEASDFLSGEASRADSIAKQLGLAQTYIIDLTAACSK